MSAIEPENGGTLLEARRLSKSFGGLKAVNRVSFRVRRNEIVGLIGPNGAGKTTLFNLIAGYYRPDDGTVTFLGRDITGWKPYRVCRLGIGRTFQVARPLSSLTVLENIVTGALLRHADCRQARRVAEEIALKVGLEDRLGKIAGGIPIADKKRLGFAQALATGAWLLLLDEVVAGLNPSEVEQFLEIVRAIVGEGMTIVMVEHVMQAVMNVAHRVLVLDHGELIAEGTPREVAENEQVIRAYLGEKYRYPRRESARDGADAERRGD
jgi:branched-chain amino acid transport system ATP-binding protein